jgi:hypothetical protein
MADSYLSIAHIASDSYMTSRMTACAAQQDQLGNVTLDDPGAWVSANAYVWASSPGWGEKWTYALDSHTDNPAYAPGNDEAVITDADILATVQALAATP